MHDSEAFAAQSGLTSRILRAAGAAAFVIMLAACDAVSEAPPRFNGTDITAVAWARGFELNDHTGRRRTLADFKGKVVLVFFGFTNCPDACPLALSEMAQVVKQLGPDADRVQGLFITVDPERDTPERLASYVPAFHPSFLGLRGTQEELEKVKQEFKIYSSAEKPARGSNWGHGKEEANYMVNHSTGIYVFDTQGRARLYFSANGRTVGAMVDDVKLLLKQ